MSTPQSHRSMDQWRSGILAHQRGSFLQIFHTTSLQGRSDSKKQCHHHVVSAGCVHPSHGQTVSRPLWKVREKSCTTPTLLYESALYVTLITREIRIFYRSFLHHDYAAQKRSSVTVRPPSAAVRIQDKTKFSGLKLQRRAHPFRRIRSGFHTVSGRARR